MTKRLFKITLLLALMAGLYAMTANAKGADNSEPTAQPSSVPTITPSGCKVQTGVDAGTVNLRSCAGTSCNVLDILTEGERLQVIAAGAWMKVTTEDGVTGWLNSKYCKGK